MAKTYHHFTYEDRVAIEQLLSIRMPLTSIAKQIGFSRQAVAREIFRNRSETGRARGFNTRWNGCAYQKGCSIKDVCNQGCTKVCCRCRNFNCVSYCSHYQKDVCKELLRAPQVCNGCNQFSRCGHIRFTYSASVANSKAQERLVKSRVGVNLTEDELSLIISVVRPLLNQGLSASVIWGISSHLLPLSKRSFYRYVEEGVFSSEIVSMHLPYKVRYKRRRRDETAQSSVLKGVLENRSYADFSQLERSVREHACEGDCVEGIKSDRCVLFTLLFRQSNLQLMLFLPRQTTECVIEKLEFLEECLGDDFPRTLLLDRGSEFSDALHMEKSALGEKKRCSVYYCDPCCAYQKGKCENNHRFIRRILPKGSSFEGLTTEKLSYMMSHINSVPRASLGGKSPLQAARDHLSYNSLKTLEAELGLREVAPSQIILKPYLLSKGC